MISVMGVTKQFGDRKAVEDVTFSVEKGGIMGFLGPNGAGKTTTMRIITGFMPPTEGSVEVNGLDVLEHPYEVKRLMGYMPEHPPLYLDMQVEGYLRFAAELRGLRGGEVKRSVERVASLCGLGDVMKRIAGNLSKGYRQRVGLAQALVHDPEVLVLDEPTVGLDPRQIVDIRNLIRELGREKTVILSTHILPEVTTVCESVTIINRGRIVASEKIESLAKKYSGGQRVLIRVSNPEKLDIKALGSLGPVREVRRLDGSSFEIVISEPSAASLSEISGAVFRMEAGVIEFSPYAPSLEEVFIKSVTEDIGVAS